MQFTGTQGFLYPNTIILNNHGSCLIFYIQNNHGIINNNRSTIQNCELLWGLKTSVTFQSHLLMTISRLYNFLQGWVQAPKMRAEIIFHKRAKNITHCNENKSAKIMRLQKSLANQKSPSLWGALGGLELLIGPWKWKNSQCSVISPGPNPSLEG